MQPPLRGGAQKSCEEGVSPGEAPSSTWQHRLVTGGNVSRAPVVFTRDSKCERIGRGGVLSGHSRSFSERMRVLEGHRGDVTGLQLNPQNSLQLYTCSLDGTIRLWDFNDEVLLRTWEVGNPISFFAIHSTRPNVAIVVTQSDKPLWLGKKSAARVYAFNLRRKSKSSGRTTTLLLKSKSKCVGMSLSSNGILLAAVCGKHLHVCDLETGSAEVFDHDRRLTCVAFHSSDAYVTTGDDEGKVISWFLAATKESHAAAPLTRTVHWHAYSVAALTFTEDGSHLLSGGVEAVLVLWQMATGQRQYLPRLGAPICGIAISPDATLYAVSLADNTIRVFSALSLRPTQTVHGLQHVGVGRLYSTRQEPCLAVEPSQRVLAMSGSCGTVQFYDPDLRRHMAAIEVVPRPLVSRSETGARLALPRVLFVAFSQDGGWMATVDRQGKDNQTYRLQFWRKEGGLQTFVVSTRVDAPHAGPISMLLFHPSRLLAVTAGHDGLFRVWSFPEESIKHSANASPGTDPMLANSPQWSCRSTGSYRGLVPRTGALSPDGSVMCIGFGQVITLWNANMDTLIGTLLAGKPDELVKQVAFVPQSSLLVATTTCGIGMWNLCSMSVVWTLPLDVHGVAVESGGQRLALAAHLPKDRAQAEEADKHADPHGRKKRKKSKRKSKAEEPTAQVDEKSARKENSRQFLLCELDPRRPVPLIAWRLHRRVDALTFSRLKEVAGDSHSSLYYFSGPGLYRVDESLQVSNIVAGKKSLVDRERGQSKVGLEAVFGPQSTEVAKANVSAERGDAQVVPRRDLPQIFGLPSHLLPPPDALCREFVSTVLAKPSSGPEDSAEGEQRSSAPDVEPRDETHDNNPVPVVKDVPVSTSNGLNDKRFTEAMTAFFQKDFADMRQKRKIST